MKILPRLGLTPSLWKRTSPTSFILIQCFTVVNNQLNLFMIELVFEVEEESTLFGS